MIVKVQRPDGRGRWLVYDETSRLLRRLTNREVTRAAKAAMQGQLRAYFEAEISGDDILLIARVEDQDW
jgi:hypothetical protein